MPRREQRIPKPRYNPKALSLIVELAILLTSEPRVTGEKPDGTDLTGTMSGYTAPPDGTIDISGF